MIEGKIRKLDTAGRSALLVVEQGKEHKLKFAERVNVEIIAEWNMDMRTIGMVGQTYERLQRQRKNAHTFSPDTKMAEGGPAHSEQWGLP